MRGQNEPQVGYIPHCRPLFAGHSRSVTALTLYDEHTAGKANTMGSDPRDQVLRARGQRAHWLALCGLGAKKGFCIFK